MKNNEDDTQFRDKVAFDIFKLLSETERHDSLELYQNWCASTDSDAPSIIKQCEKDLTNKISVSYRVADLFRKVRLGAFQ